MSSCLYEILDRNDLEKELCRIFGDLNWRYYNVNNIITKKFKNCDKLKFLGTIGRDFDV